MTRLARVFAATTAAAAGVSAQLNGASDDNSVTGGLNEQYPNSKKRACDLCRHFVMRSSCNFLENFTCRVKGHQFLSNISQSNMASTQKTFGDGGDKAHGATVGSDKTYDKDDTSQNKNADIEDNKMWIWKVAPEASTAGEGEENCMGDEDVLNPENNMATEGFPETAVGASPSSFLYSNNGENAGAFCNAMRSWTWDHGNALQRASEGSAHTLQYVNSFLWKLDADKTRCSVQKQGQITNTDADLAPFNTDNDDDHFGVGQLAKVLNVSLTSGTENCTEEEHAKKQRELWLAQNRWSMCYCYQEKTGDQVLKTLNDGA